MNLPKEVLPVLKGIFSYATKQEYIEHLTNTLTENLPDERDQLKEAIILHTNMVCMVCMLHSISKQE